MFSHACYTYSHEEGATSVDVISCTLIPSSNSLHNIRASIFNYREEFNGATPDKIFATERSRFVDRQGIAATYSRVKYIDRPLYAASLDISIDEFIARYTSACLYASVSLTDRAVKAAFKYLAGCASRGCSAFKLVSIDGEGEVRRARCAGRRKPTRR